MAGMEPGGNGVATQRRSWGRDVSGGSRELEMAGGGCWRRLSARPCMRRKRREVCGADVVMRCG